MTEIFTQQDYRQWILEEMKACHRPLTQDEVAFAVSLRTKVCEAEAMLKLLREGRIEVEFNYENPDDSRIRVAERVSASR